MSFCYECCVLSDRGLCIGWSLVHRSPTECCVCNECDREAPGVGGGMTQNRVEAPQGKK
jgi:hypothetical protein